MFEFNARDFVQLLDALSTVRELLDDVLQNSNARTIRKKWQKPGNG
jgi:hypothetical protein